MKKALEIRAGKNAYARIAKDGLRPEDIRVMAGAAGGPKWLALGQLDRFLFGEWFKDRNAPLYTIGSSVGSWRFAAAANPDPVGAINAFERAYLSYEYSSKPDAAEISAVAAKLVDCFLDVDAVLNHRYIRPTTLTALCKGRIASDQPLAQKAGLAAAAAANARGRDRLSDYFERVLFTHPAGEPPFATFADAFTTHQVPMTAENARAALLASAAIPLVLEGVRDIPGSPTGCHRDGGLIDYHLAIDFGVHDGIVFMPHFGTEIVPGWLDKFLPWRKPDAKLFDNVLLVAPSPELLEKLPNGKIPDRKDFQRYKGDFERLYRDWQQAADECEAMAEDFATWADSDHPEMRILPI